MLPPPMKLPSLRQKDWNCAPVRWTSAEPASGRLFFGTKRATAQPPLLRRPDGSSTPAGKEFAEDHPKPNAQPKPEALEAVRNSVESRETARHSSESARIDSIDVMTGTTIISEAGYDMSKWKTENHFVSWLRLCPDNRICHLGPPARETS
jgi:hypothetical protein